MEETRSLKARRLKSEGKSYAFIGLELGVSRQRAHQLATGYKSPAYLRIRRPKKA
jgi:hypothetical protein